MNVKDYMAGRNDGLNLALRCVNEGGVEKLQEEIRIRGRFPDLPSQITLEKCLEIERRISEYVFSTVLLCSLEALMCEFEYGQKRLERFVKRFQDITDCMLDEQVNWEDLIEEMQDVVGCTIELGSNRIEFKERKKEK